MTPTQTSCLGQRRKGLARKVRRSQRPCGRQCGIPPSKVGGGKTVEEEREEAGAEETMEAEAEQDERMEEDTVKQEGV